MDKRSNKGYRQLYHHAFEDPFKLVQAAWSWYERWRPRYILDFLVAVHKLRPDALYSGIITVEQTFFCTLVDQALVLAQQAVIAGRFEHEALAHLNEISDFIQAVVCMPDDFGGWYLRVALGGRNARSIYDGVSAIANLADFSTIENSVYFTEKTLASLTRMARKLWEKMRGTPDDLGSGPCYRVGCEQPSLGRYLPSQYQAVSLRGSI
ncbi:hypothetical protein BDV98DRAFT_606584 [Pterulicium gracile]|uniref:Uncharacterized protein n=1 Tax=Pterulicium gracile TaxID=1884261 RepID=A0A5C3QFA2_9AGAR|nr:hypothetical protein BDV98DRAFT_606584 [Pterula gracilis]